MQLKTVVVSQPMFFPWAGLFEQIRLADVFVYYDDVQFSKGSFENRVQIKTAAGLKWLTVPVRYERLSKTLLETHVDDSRDWRGSHLAFLRQQFRSAPFVGEALSIVEKVYSRSVTSLAELSIASMDEVCSYFEIADPLQFKRSSSLGIPGRSSARVLDIVGAFEGLRYVTGHGAKNYLDHEAFEERGVRVEYMDYAMQAYPQLFGPFTGSVSILDLIANMGHAGREILSPRTVFWKEFVRGRD